MSDANIDAWRRTNELRSQIKRTGDQIAIALVLSAAVIALALTFAR